MAPTDLDALLHLPPAERLELIEKLWESLAPTPEVVPVPEAHRQELDRRLDSPAPGPLVTPEELADRLRRRPR